MSEISMSSLLNISSNDRVIISESFEEIRTTSISLFEKNEYYSQIPIRVQKYLTIYAFNFVIKLIYNQIKFQSNSITPVGNLIEFSRKKPIFSEFLISSRNTSKVEYISYDKVVELAKPYIIRNFKEILSNYYQLFKKIKAASTQLSSFNEIELPQIISLNFEMEDKYFSPCLNEKFSIESYLDYSFNSFPTSNFIKNNFYRLHTSIVLPLANELKLKVRFNEFCVLNISSTIINESMDSTKVSYIEKSFLKFFKAGMAIEISSVYFSKKEIIQSIKESPMIEDFGVLLELAHSDSLVITLPYYIEGSKVSRYVLEQLPSINLHSLNN